MYGILDESGARRAVGFHEETAALGGHLLYSHTPSGNVNPEDSRTFSSFYPRSNSIYTIPGSIVDHAVGCISGPGVVRYSFVFQFPLKNRKLSKRVRSIDPDQRSFDCYFSHLAMQREWVESGLGPGRVVCPVCLTDYAASNAHRHKCKGPFQFPQP